MVAFFAGWGGLPEGFVILGEGVVWGGGEAGVGTGGFGFSEFLDFGRGVAGGAISMKSAAVRIPARAGRPGSQVEAGPAPIHWAVMMMAAMEAKMMRLAKRDGLRRNPQARAMERRKMVSKATERRLSGLGGVSPDSAMMPARVAGSDDEKARVAAGAADCSSNKTGWRGFSLGKSWGSPSISSLAEMRFVDSRESLGGTNRPKGSMGMTGPVVPNFMNSPRRISRSSGLRLRRVSVATVGNERMMRSSQRASMGMAEGSVSDSMLVNPESAFSPPRRMVVMGIWLTAGMRVTSPWMALGASEARRKEAGTGLSEMPRVTGAAVVRDLKLASCRSMAARPMLSGLSHARTAAMERSVAPRRWMFCRVTAMSMGEGGEVWKTPSGSSVMEMSEGECFARSPEGSPTVR